MTVKVWPLVGVPTKIVVPETAIVPGVDGQKMSKSYDNYIPIFASAKDLKSKVMSIKTDSTPFGQPLDPDTCNVFALYRLFASAEEIEQALARREAARWREPLDATIVLRTSADHLRLHIPAGQNGASAKLEIEWEGGDLEHHWFWMPELATLESKVIDGSEWLAKRLPLPKTLRLGFHRMRVHWVQEPELRTFAEARYIGRTLIDTTSTPNVQYGQGGVVIVNASLAYAWDRDLDLTASVVNLFNKEYSENSYTYNQPYNRTLSAPRMVYGGVKLRF